MEYVKISMGSTYRQNRFTCGKTKKYAYYIPEQDAVGYYIVTFGSSNACNLSGDPGQGGEESGATKGLIHKVGASLISVILLSMYQI